jgi:hypothetical protein
VDAGTGPAAVAGPDGLVAGREDAQTSCPADALSEEDADALLKLVGFLAARHADTITLAGDSSPRGTTAAERQGLRVTSESAQQAALVVVAAWSGAYSAVTRAAQAPRETPTYTYGSYDAPWLVTGPIVNTVSASTVPVRFEPQATACGEFRGRPRGGLRRREPDRGRFGPGSARRAE